MANEFEYNVLGRRIQKCYSSTTVRYFYAGARVIEETDGGSTPTILRRFLYGNGIDEVLLMENATSGAKYFYMDNALGNGMALVDDATNTIAESYRHTVLGKPLSTSSVGNPYFFTGRRLDETELYYFRARYYDPMQGRFLQRDPIPLQGGSFLVGPDGKLYTIRLGKLASLRPRNSARFHTGFAERMKSRFNVSGRLAEFVNLYQYGGNNPANNTDPLGLEYRQPPGAETYEGMDCWEIKQRCIHEAYAWYERCLKDCLWHFYIPWCAYQCKLGLENDLGRCSELFNRCVATRG